ncbi:MAG: antitoxin [Opitutaceae bacterium]
MRTTLEIDDAVLGAAREVAQTEGVSTGHVISTWARRGLNAETAKAKKRRSGFPVFDVPADARPLTPALVNSIIDDERPPA